MDKLYPIEKSPLYKLSSRKRFIELLGGGFSYSKLEELSTNTSQYYRNFKLKTNRGKEREVAQCLGELASIQKRIQVLLRRIEFPVYLYSKRQCSIKMNADLHRENQYVFTVDLKNFYPSCSLERLASSLCFHFKQSGDISRLIAKLLTLNDKIPQGSTTSANAAFIANKTMFDEINSLCLEYGMKLSVFVDDLTISSLTPVEQSFRNKVIAIIRKNSMPISYQKIKYFKKNQAKHITGLVVHENQVKMENNKFKRLFIELKNKEALNSSTVGLYRYIKQIEPKLRVSILEYTSS